MAVIGDGGSVSPRAKYKHLSLPELQHLYGAIYLYRTSGVSHHALVTQLEKEIEEALVGRKGLGPENDPAYQGLRNLRDAA